MNIAHVSLFAGLEEYCAFEKSGIMPVLFIEELSKV